MVWPKLGEFGIMQIRVDNSMVEFSGHLSEKSDSEAIKKAVLQALAAASNGIIRIDFSKVEKANSVGILTYLKTFTALKIKAVYERVPVWLVEQFNVIDEFLDEDAMVSSVFAQFYCTETNSTVTRELKVGTDIPILADYSLFNPCIKDDAGNELEADFDPCAYFDFISIHNERYKK